MAGTAKKTAAAAALLLASASAHLEPGSLSSPAAGLTYAAGSQVVITWVQAEFHQGRYALAWSSDGGSTWKPIADWPGPSGDQVTVRYPWTIPDAPGSATRIRVCQIQVCDDPDYVLISGDFTIAPASGVVEPVGPPAGASLHFLPAPGILEVDFSLDRPGRVALEAFDARGARIAAWLEGIHAAGCHAYSLDARKFGSGGPLILRLSLGGSLAAQARILPR